MKKALKAALAILIIVSLAMAVASCGGGGGGNSPKSLAKQSYDTAQELTKLKADGVPNPNSRSKCNENLIRCFET